MIKNSTIIITAILVFLGIIINGVIDNIFERKNLKDINTAKNEIKKLEINEKLLNFKPISFQVEGAELIYLPKISFKNGHMDIDYSFYKYEEQSLIKIPINDK